MSALSVSPLSTYRPPQAPVSYANPPNLASPSVSPASPVQYPNTTDLRIIYTNDTHEKYQSFPGLVTGFNQTRQQARQQGIDVLAAADGDWNIGPQPEEMNLNVQLNNMLGIDASTLGNHEFDAGDDVLANALRNARFTTLASNLLVPPSSPLYQRLLDGTLQTNSQILVTRNGQRIGLVGLTVPDTWQYLNPDAPMHDVVSMTFPDSLTKLQGDVNQLRQRGINRIVLISHAGYDKDLEVARRVDGIDVIVGGHTHTTLSGVQPGINYVTSPSGEPVMIVQTGKDAKAFGVLDVKWDADGRVMPQSNALYNPRNFARNPQAVAMIDSIKGPEQVIGMVASETSTEGSATDGENGVADKVADAIRIQTGADIGMFRGTELRNSLYPGPFSDRDLHILLPFNDPLVTFDMTGAQVLEALTTSAQTIQTHNNHPGLMVGSGLRYTVDPTQGRVTNAFVWNRTQGQWQPLDTNRHYTVSAGDFIAKNRHEYPVFKTVPIVRQFPFSARDAFGQWILNQQGRPLQFPIDGRLQLVPSAPAQPAPYIGGLVTNPFSQPLPVFAAKKYLII